MLTQYAARIEGIAGTLQNNGMRANPLDRYTKEAAKITAKRKKSDADHQLLCDLDWLGGLYLTQEGEFDVHEDHVELTGDWGEPIWPGDNITAMLAEGARRYKLGRKFKSAVYVLADSVIEHSGPKKLAKLLRDGRYRLTAPCRVSMRVVMRTRPFFFPWACNIVIHADDNEVTEQQLRDVLRDCGLYVGLSDWRPKYGRFEVVSFEERNIDGS